MRLKHSMSGYKFFIYVATNMLIFRCYELVWSIFAISSSIYCLYARFLFSDKVNYILFFIHPQLFTDICFALINGRNTLLCHHTDFFCRELGT